MRKLGLQAVASLSIAGIAFACASDPPEDFVPPGGTSSSGSSVPGGEGGASSGGSSGTSSSGGSSSGSSGGDAASDTGSGANCANHAPVSDKPACDTCSKAKCCNEIKACDASPSCKAAQDCIAKCGADDFGCALDCYIAAGNGADLLTDVASCAQSKCGSECGGAGDGGFDSPF